MSTAAHAASPSEVEEQHRRLREEVIAFARAELDPGAADRDRAQAFGREPWRRSGGLRLPGLVIPEALGGRGLDPVSAAVALEALGYACSDGGLAFAMAAHLLACGVPLWRHGDEAQQRRFLPGMCDGSLIAANAMSEPGAGSDAYAMTTTATRDGDGWRLAGHKTFVSNGPECDLVVTYARTGEAADRGGLTAFVLPRDTKGLRFGPRLDKTALRSCAMGEVYFEGARAEAGAVLGRAGGGAAIFAESMEWERALLGALHVGTMQRVLEAAVAHARTRKAFGQAIGKFQAVSHRIADMKVRLEAARLLTRQAASRLGRRDAGLDAAIAKLFVSESLLESALDLVRTLGAHGVLQQHEAERMLRDAVASTIYSGTSDIQRNIVARWLGL